MTTLEPNDIPYGFCHCGCGERTNVARVTVPKQNWVKGEPRLFIKGHSSRVRVEPPPDKRFWAKVEIADDGCWLWTGNRARGYAEFSANGRVKYKAHRWAYERFVGPIPEGLQLDHLCRVRHCVNPAHLEPVTQAENIRRGVSPSAHNSRKTHCKRGHEFTPENTYFRPERNQRECRTCMRARRRADWLARGLDGEGE